MKEKYGALIKDLFFFTISTFIPKAISFFLVPLYTNYLTTAEYGIADLVSTTVSLLVPILTLDINDAVMRYTIEDKDDKEPFRIAFFMVLKSIIIVVIAFAINNIFNIFELDYQITIFCILNYIFISIYGICIAYLRATEKVKLLSIISILITIITVASNIFLLVVLKAGVIGYMISGCLGYAIVDIVVLIRINVLKLIKKEQEKNSNLKKQMLAYSLPLIAANISWWINSSADRYIVTAICGVEENGIYSVAYKIPTILQMLQSVFSQAWLLSVFREYKKENGSKYVSNVYEIYYVAMCISCSILIVLDIPLAKFLYANKFFEAWKYVPFLLISVVFIANSGFFESMLTLQKKSTFVAYTTILGALVNIILNFILIYNVGTIGAAIATMCGYFVMWISRIKVVMKGYKFQVNWGKQIIIYILLIAEAIVMLETRDYILCIGIVILIFLLNIKIIKNIIKQMVCKLKGAV